VIAGHTFHASAVGPSGRKAEKEHEMTELSTAPAEEMNLIEELEPAVEEVSQAPILITEQEVAFSTAAAEPARPAKARRWIAALRAMFEDRPKRQHYPARLTFLEHAAMAREMERL
jgi:hypothetical protein